MYSLYVVYVSVGDLHGKDRKSEGLVCNFELTAMLGNTAAEPRLHKSLIEVVQVLRMFFTVLEAD